jgi:hypothetical protein
MIGNAFVPTQKQAPLLHETETTVEDAAPSARTLQVDVEGGGSLCLNSFAHCRAAVEAISMCLYDDSNSVMGWSNVVRDEVMVCELLVSDRGCDNGLTANRVHASVVLIDAGQGEVLIQVDRMWKIVRFHGYAGQTSLPEDGTTLSSALATFPQAINLGDSDTKKAVSLKLVGLEPGSRVTVHARLCVDRAEVMSAEKKEIDQ